MKTWKRVGLVVLAASFSAGCSDATGSVADTGDLETSVVSESEASGPETPAVDPALASVRTSNLVDEQSRHEVYTVLKNAGLGEQALNDFDTQVKRFYDHVPTASLIQSGFQPLAQAQKADLVALAQAAQEKATPLTNCRITTFTLGREQVTVGKPQGADDSQLFFDIESLDTEPKMFVGAERETFLGLFGRVPTVAEKDSQRHTNDIINYLLEHEIGFKVGPVSMVSVYIHDNIDPKDAAMFIGHMGLLVEDSAEGKLLFVEKLAFDQPYRASWFDSREQLETYLRSMYDDGPDLEYGQPVIMENDHVMQATQMY
ncbi:DUF4300 family protein [Arcanobacterium phocisimile]|uniref:DUF4300 family protein n=1 Tax=Arcanobacterium phocisimile TaxID=1302235 RepID=A0ABX7IJA6_9ACTO|nr:DUF4300 family protein [Arcanobacterium phocisimile]QRV01928.1 DUF4300 family protein [Arcanobacterium phocisimile]